MAAPQSSRDIWHGRGNAQPRHRSESRRLSDRRRTAKIAPYKREHSPGALHEGDLVQVFCRSADQWVVGEVVKFFEGNFVRVEYEVDEYWHGKTMHLHSEHLDIPSAVSHEEHDPGMVWSAGELHERGALASYFHTGYLKGEDPPEEDLRRAGYEVQYNDKLSAHVFYHKPTGIQVWCEALDLSTPGRHTSQIRLGFHYTTPKVLSTVTHGGNEAVEIWASLQGAGDAFFGDGVYASQGDPQQHGSIEAVLYNNYMKAILKNPSKLRERWDCALCCIPILVDHEACVDVRRQATPEMKGPGLDKWGNPLDENEAMAAHMQQQSQKLQRKLRNLCDKGRDVVVLRTTDRAGVVVNARVPDNLLKVLKRRLVWLQKAMGEDHPRVATTRNNMGLVYDQQSKFADALREYEEALRIDIATLGKDHPDVACTRNNMGAVYQKQSKFADALREYDEVLRIKMATLGKDHPSVATTRNNMGSVYKEQSKFADALREYDESLRIGMATLGKDHPHVATTRNNMGLVYQQQSKFADALREYKEALRIDIVTLGKDHPDVAEMQERMSLCYCRMRGRYL